MGECFLEILEGLEVSLIAGLNDLFDAVVAGDANGVGGAHLREIGFVGGHFLPEGEPVLCGFWVVEEGEEIAFGFVGSHASQLTEEEGEVHLLVGEELEGGADEVGVGLRIDAEFGTEAGVIIFCELFGVIFERLLGEGFGLVEIGV